MLPPECGNTSAHSILGVSVTEWSKEKPAVCNPLFLLYDELKKMKREFMKGGSVCRRIFCFLEFRFADSSPPKKVVGQKAPDSRFETGNRAVDGVSTGKAFKPKR
jgi:hypothetical protein